MMIKENGEIFSSAGQRWSHTFPFFKCCIINLQNKLSHNSLFVDLVSHLCIAEWILDNSFWFSWCFLFFCGVFWFFCLFWGGGDVFLFFFLFLFFVGFFLWLVSWFFGGFLCILGDLGGACGFFILCFGLGFWAGFLLFFVWFDFGFVWFEVFFGWGFFKNLLFFAWFCSLTVEWFSYCTEV